MSIQIILADFENPRHCEAIPFLINSYAADPIGGGCTIDPAVLDRIVPGLRAHPSAIIFLAFDGERPVGIANCFLGFSTFAAMPLLNIHDLAVLPDMRGKGVGLRLLEAVEEKGRDLGCCKLTLEVRRDNNRARNVYERFGFGDFTAGTDRVPTIFLEKSLKK